MRMSESPNGSYLLKGDPIRLQLKEAVVSALDEAERQLTERGVRKSEIASFFYSLADAQLRWLDERGEPLAEEIGTGGGELLAMELAAVIERRAAEIALAEHGIVTP